MKIEWDENKRAQTLNERGLDFANVAFLEWGKALTLQDTRKNYGEPRYITYGRIKDRLCVLAWTERNGVMRIFSLRKANAREVKRHG